MTGYVYAIRNADGLVKIGWSSDPRRRLIKINSDTSSRCELVGTIEGTRADEQRIHRRLTDYRVHGEWYRPSAVVLISLDDFTLTPEVKDRRSVSANTNHPLDLWRAGRGLSVDALAILIGVTQGRVSQIFRGASLSLALAAHIEGVTAGAVTMQQLARACGLMPSEAAQ